MSSSGDRSRYIACIMNGGRSKVLRTLDTLRNNKVVLNKTIKQITISYDTKKPGVAGTRYFLYDVVPPLRYHNPSVAFAVNKDKDGTAVIVERETGMVRIDARGKTAEDILRELIAKTDSSDERANVTLHPAWARKTTQQAA